MLAMLADLLGEKRLALHYGYVKKNWTVLDENLIKELNTNRRKSINKYARPIHVTRWEHTETK